VTVAVDTSILILRSRDTAIGAWFRDRVLADEIAIPDLVRLEYLRGARNGVHYDVLEDGLRALHQIAMERADWDRAAEVQRLLAHQTGGGQRAVSLPDLLIAAAAERAGLELVHADAHFDRIAALTGQPTRFVRVSA
jgi:predicted nucleic acid-binding protein